MKSTLQSIRSWQRPYPFPPCEISKITASGYASIANKHTRIVNTSILNKNIFLTIALNRKESES